MDPARPGSELSTNARTSKILIALTVLGVLLGVAGLLVPRLAGDGGEESRRAEVVSRATDFAVTYNTYDVAEKDDYQERMEGLLTDGYYTEFTRVTDAVFAALESKDQTSGDAEVLSVAVDTMDDDSAVALVAVNANIATAADEAAVQRRFRWKVTFGREGDEWVVSQFESVVPLEATTGEEADPGADPADPEATEPAPTPSTEDE